MGFKIMSVLGNSNYESMMHSYSFQNIVDTPFVQEAVLSMFKDKIEKESGEFCVFLTKSARETNYILFEKRIKFRFPNLCLIPIDIMDGKNEEEIWKIFDAIYGAINESDEIILDITHSFRHIPILMIIVMNYARVLKNIKLEGIYYGALEAKYKDGEIDVLPVFDLSEFESLMEWSYSANTFINYGNVKPILDSYRKLRRQKGNKWNQENKNFSNFIKSLADFSNCIYTARGTPEKLLKTGKGLVEKNPEKKSLQVSFKKLLSSYDRLADEKNSELQKIVPIVEKVIKSVDGFSEDSSLKTGIAAIEWSIEKNLIQQAYTILFETIKTYVCIIYGLDETDYESRESVVKASLNELTRKFHTSDINETDISDEARKKRLEIISNLDERVYKLYARVGSRRNDINHFGYTRDNISYEVLIDDIKKHFDEFMEIIRTDGKTIL